MISGTPTRRNILLGSAVGAAAIAGSAHAQFATILGYNPEAAQVSFDTVAKNLAFPEGPALLPDGAILFAEMFAGRLSRYRAGKGIEPFATVGGGPNGTAVGPDGWLYVTNNGGIRSYPDRRVPENWAGGWVDKINLATGEKHRVATHAGQRRLSGPNDLVFDGQGGFWCTDAGRKRDQWQDHGAVCYCDLASGAVRDVVYPLVTPNGIGLSPDRTRLYVASTLQRQLLAYEIAAPGRLRGEQSNPTSTILASIAGRLIMDSLKVEASGNIVVACMGQDPGGLLVVTPEGATSMVVLGAPVSNLVFTGSDLRTLLITAGSETNGALLQLRWPRAGLRLTY